MKDLIGSVVFGVILVFLMYVPGTSGGECCRVTRPFMPMWEYDQVWCPVFCCGEPLVGVRCCTDYRSRAPKHYRHDFCAAWFTHPGHMWLPIITALVVLAIIIACVVCCCRVCCIF